MSTSEDFHVNGESFVASLPNRGSCNPEKLLQSFISEQELDLLNEKLKSVDSTHDDAQTLCTADVIRTATSAPTMFKRQLDDDTTTNGERVSYRQSIRKALEWEEQLRQIRRVVNDHGNVGKLLPLFKPIAAECRSVAVLHVKSIVISSIFVRSRIKRMLLRGARTDAQCLYLSVFADNGYALIVRKPCLLFTENEEEMNFKHFVQCNRDSKFVLPLNLRLAIPANVPQPSRNCGVGRIGLSFQIDIWGDIFTALDFESEAHIIGKSSVRSFRRYDQGRGVIDKDLINGSSLPSGWLPHHPATSLKDLQMRQRSMKFDDVLFHSSTGQQMKMAVRLVEILALHHSIPGSGPSIHLRLKEMFGGNRKNSQAAVKSGDGGVLANAGTNISDTAQNATMATSISQGKSVGYQMYDNQHAMSWNGAANVPANFNGRNSYHLHSLKEKSDFVTTESLRNAPASSNEQKLGDTNIYQHKLNCLPSSQPNLTPQASLSRGQDMYYAAAQPPQVSMGMNFAGHQREAEGGSYVPQGPFIGRAGDQYGHLGPRNNAYIRNMPFHTNPYMQQWLMMNQMGGVMPGMRQESSIPPGQFGHAMNIPSVNNNVHPSMMMPQQMNAAGINPLMAHPRGNYGPTMPYSSSARQPQLRVLQLNPPERSTPSYNISLPHDCEGLLFAMEGKFDCGDDIVCDAAARIIEALCDRAAKLTAALSGDMTLARPRVKIQRLKLLESSWVTSTYLAKRISRIALDLVGRIDAEQCPASCKRDMQPHAYVEKMRKTPRKSELADSQQNVNADEEMIDTAGPTVGKTNTPQPTIDYLDLLEQNARRVEALTTSFQILERWAKLRLCVGLVKRDPQPKINPSSSSPRITYSDDPKFANKVAAALKTCLENSSETKASSPKSIVQTSDGVSNSLNTALHDSENPSSGPPVVVKRKRGRPPGSGMTRNGYRQNIRPSVTLGDFVDALNGGTETLRLPSQLTQQLNAFDDLEEIVLKVGPLWKKVFVEAERKLRKQQDHDLHHVQSTSDKPNVQLPDNLVDANTNTSLLINDPWPTANTGVFEDPELAHLFSESVKEAEFILWRERRRQSLSGASGESFTESNTSALSQNLNAKIGGGNDGEDINMLIGLLEDDRDCNRARYHRQLKKMKKDDLSLKYSSLLLMNQLMISHFRLCVMLAIGGSEKAEEHLIQLIEDLWSEFDEIQPMRCPKLCELVGPGLFNLILNFAWDRALNSTLEVDRPFRTVVYRVATYSLRAFGRFVTCFLFPSVSSGISKLMDEESADRNEILVPVELNIVQDALFTLFVGIDKLKSLKSLARTCGIPVREFLTSLLFCTFGAAVIKGRLIGFVSDFDALKTDSVGVDISNKKRQGDSRTMKILLANLPQPLADRTLSILTQKKPTLDLENDPIAPEYSTIGTRNSFSKSPLSAPLAYKLDETPLPNKFLANAQIVSGSYTQPRKTTEASEATPLLNPLSRDDLTDRRESVDTQKERSSIGNAAEFAPLFEDIVFACGSLFIRIAEDNDEECYKFMEQSLPVFREITVLSRSPVIAKLVQNIEEGFSNGGFFLQDCSSSSDREDITSNHDAPAVNEKPIFTSPWEEGMKCN